MSAYTKGPWINDGEVSSREGKSVLIVCGEQEAATVIKVVGPNRENDSHLVISAPALLEALKAILVNPSSMIANPNLEAALAAIAKAEGK